MEPPRTVGDLRVRVSCALLEASPPELEGVQKAIFGDVAPDSNMLQLLRKTYEAQLSVIALAHCKEFIVSSFNVIDDVAETIAEYESCSAEKRELFFLPDPSTYAMLCALKKEDMHKSLYEEIDSSYRLIVSCVNRTEKEDAFRDVLLAKLRSGDLTKEEWGLIKYWREIGPTLDSFLRIFKEKNGMRKVVAAATELRKRTVEFKDMGKITTLLNMYCWSVTKTVGQCATVTGYTVFLSEYLEWIEDQLKKGARSIAIYAHDCCGVDVDLAGSAWSGKNLVIYSNMLNIWKKSLIDLSGMSPKEGEKSEKKENSEFKGRGADGAPGGSSGNLAICVDQLIHGEWLSVRLNGGRGENGMDGADGRDGIPGTGITAEEFKKRTWEYWSLTFQSWDNFTGPVPNSEGAKGMVDIIDIANEYRYVQFEDAQGHAVSYSLAGERHIFPAPSTIYDLVVVVRGTRGTPGTNGAKGGEGGEGGYPGQCHIQNHNGDRHIIGECSTDNGERGRKGRRGIDGRQGRNGHDMALVDRSGLWHVSNPTVLGGYGKQLVEKYLDEREGDCWISGFRRHKLDLKNCYIAFLEDNVDSVMNIIVPVNREQQQQQHQQRKATATATINMAEEMQRFKDAFRERSASIAALCLRQQINEAVPIMERINIRSSDKHQRILTFEDGEEETDSSQPPLPDLASVAQRSQNTNDHLQLVRQFFKKELSKDEMKDIKPTVLLSLKWLCAKAENENEAQQITTHLRKIFGKDACASASYMEKCSSFISLKEELSSRRLTNKQFWTQFSTATVNVRETGMSGSVYGLARRPLQQPLEKEQIIDFTVQKAEKDVGLHELVTVQDEMYAASDSEIIRSIVKAAIDNKICAPIVEGAGVDKRLLDNISTRFALDGRHLSRVDVQFVLDTCTNLMSKFACSVEFLASCVMRLPQNEWVDFAVLLCIVYHCRSRDVSYRFFSRNLGSEGSTTEQKATFVRTLFASGPSLIPEGAIFEMLTQLKSKCSTADKPMDTDVGQHYILDYYLQKLNEEGFKKEVEELLGLLADHPKTSIDTVGKVVSSILGLDKKWMDEIKKVRPTNPTDKLESNPRTIDEALELVVRLHNVDNDSNNTTNEVNQSRVERLNKLIGSLGELMTSAVCKDEKTETRFLLEFEEILEKKMKIKLHATQKVAIMCALRSEQHLLQQVATGEGKSLIIAAIAAVSCMMREDATVDIITSSPTLAIRDAERMEPIFEALGLTVSHNCCECREDREKAYKARIVYGDMAHFQRDFLIHEYYRENIRGDRRMDKSVVIVDEVDNMLLDNGNNILYLSHGIPGLRLLDSLLFFIYQLVCDAQDSALEQGRRTDDIDIQHIKEAVLAELQGPSTTSSLRLIDESIPTVLIEKAVIDHEGYLLLIGIDNLFKAEEALKDYNEVVKRRVLDCFRAVLTRDRSFVLPPNLIAFARLHLGELIENCRRAMRMVEDTDYVLDTGRTDLEIGVTIIDRHTGADMSSSQWAGGLHQFVEMRHACRISPLCLKAVFVSNVSYLKEYNRLLGLSGTLGSKDECRMLSHVDFYNSDLIAIPTNKPRRFYEKPPVVATSHEEWIQALNDQIKEEVDKGRAVLVVCDTIHQLQLVETGLHGLHPPINPPDWLCTLRTYRRQHDEFEFEQVDKAAQPRQLILATNLAGRGTDIHLSREVIEVGGLHVIVASMSPNKRVEEQAFGRAARAGQPGTAQIVACDTSGASITARVRLRDQVERDRLSTLKNHYECHTQVEEKCLKKFRKAAEVKIFKTKEFVADRFPEAEQVIYRAMLDQWALWLDEKEPEMKLCESKEQRKKIIASVESFVKELVVDKDKEKRFLIPSWIESGERLLALGVVLMRHKGGRIVAEQTFNRVIQNGGDYAAYAFYYRACMRLDGFEHMRKKSDTMVTDPYERFKAGGAHRLFLQARVLFVEQLARKTRQMSAALSRASRADSNCGLRAQLMAMTAAYEHIVSNIDWLIGAPLSRGIFTEAFGSQGDAIYTAMKELGIIQSPKANGKRFEEIADVQNAQLRYALGLSPMEIDRMLSEFGEKKKKKEEGKEEEEPLNKSIIEEPKHCKLPARSIFWRYMYQKRVFIDPRIICVVRIGEEKRVAEAIGENPLALTDEQVRYSVRFTNEPVHGVALYSASSIAAKPEEGKKLLDDGTLRIDLITQIDIECLKTTPYLDQFEGFTLAEMREHLSISDHTALRLVNMMLRSGVLNIGQNRERSQSTEQGVAPNLEAIVFRLEGVDCTRLPAVFAESLHLFLQHRCAFTLAIDALIRACDDSAHATDVTKQIQLPEDPYNELIDELTRLEVISAPRFELTHAQMEDMIDYDDFNYVKESRVRKFVDSRRSKITDSTSMLAIVPFAKCIELRDGEVDSEMHALMEMGMTVGVISKQSLGGFLKYNGLRGASFVLSLGVDLCVLIGKTIGFLANAVSHAAYTAVATVANATLSENAQQNLHDVASKTVDGINSVFVSVENGFSWLIKTIAQYVDRNKRISSRLTDVGSIAARLMRRINSYCQATIGSYRYYHQLRKAARVTSFDALTEHRIIRLYNDLSGAAKRDAETMSQQEMEVSDKTNELAKKLESDLLGAIEPMAIKYGQNKRGWTSMPAEEMLDKLSLWFRRELDHLVAYKVIQAHWYLRAFAADRSSPENKSDLPPSVHIYSAVLLAYKTMSKELGETLVYEAQNNSKTSDKHKFTTKDYQDFIERTVNECVETKFTAQLASMIRTLCELRPIEQELWGRNEAGQDPATNNILLSANRPRPLIAPHPFTPAKTQYSNAERRDWLLSEFHKIIAMGRDVEEQTQIEQHWH